MNYSSIPGKNFSEVEVTHISPFGIWILVRDKEYFLPYEDFPWFLKASLEEILEVEEVSPGHLYWPKLDIDLSLEIIEHPEKYPLKAKHETH